ncbi:MAG: hypothetical protein HQK54_04155 [Oligoflexales bacterium]|nr:hypothetical protein [Oligoflexales bacterium]
MFRLNIHTLFIVMILSVIAGYLFIKWFPGARLTAIITSIFTANSITQIATLDGSISARVADIYYSNMSLIQDFPKSFGHNLANFDELFYYGKIYRNEIFGSYLMSEHIMSGIGSVVFELGFIGITLPLMIFFRFMMSPDKGARSFGISLPLVMLITVTLTHPLAGLIIGLNEQAFAKTSSEE